jgi:two-component system, sensor histidine kinase ChiS
LIVFSVFIYYRNIQSKYKATLQQLQQENQRLLQIDSLKDELLTNTSPHIDGIIGIVESLNEGVAGQPTEAMKSNLHMLLSSSKRLSSLINDILDFSTLKSNHLSIKQQPIDLRSLAEIVLKLSESFITGKKLVLINEIKTSLAPVWGDENRILQILHNLIDNAIKYTETGRIIISAKQLQDTIEVAVFDTGSGIAKDQFSSIFDMYGQSNTVNICKNGGAGLGLNVTKQLVELHHGKIWVESEVGKGSCFYFTLPVSKQPLETYVAEKVPPKISHPVITEVPRLSPDCQNPHILIVDDDAVNLMVLVNYLKPNDYTITQASSGLQALEIVKKQTPNLILLDVMMPNMSGYEVCEIIRKTNLANELPIIFLTAKNQVSDLVEGFRLGANDYLTKPVSKQELLARIHTQLELASMNIAYSRFVPHQFIELLGRRDIIDLRLGDQTQRKMSVLFADIRNFTDLSEQMAPDENFRFINHYLSYMGPSVSKNNGFIDKYIGDAIMALFPDSADDAINAAIDMKDNLEKFNIDWKNKGGTPIKIGIGVNTGELMLGTLGEIDRMEGTVISDSVNLASRLEELTKLYGSSILVSEFTMQDVKNLEHYHYRLLGKTKVKGKMDEVTIYDLYSGDSDEVIELKQITQENFETGLNLYIKNDYTNAAVLFKKVLDINPNDKSAQLYLERCAHFMVSGKSNQWVG